MTVLPQVLTLLLAGLSLYLAASSGVKHGSEPVVKLAERVGALERLLLYQNMRVEQLEADRQEMTDTVAALTDKVTSLTDNVASLADTVTALTDKVASLTDKVASLTDTVAALTDKAASLTDKVASLTDKVASLTAENQMLRDRDSVPDSRVDKLEKESQSSETRDRDVAARSDDAGPLEVVVTQVAQRLTEVSADVQALKTADQHRVQAIQEAATSTFTRWGHSACPASNSLVYSGVIGGEWSENTGAAGNYLCLTLSPVQLDAPSSIGGWAQLYGTEYNTYDSHQDKNAVCAVCRSPRPTVVMVPGTNVCWSGWTVEYSGYLMADDPRYGAGTEFICVDSAMQSSNSGDGRQNGAFLIYTRSYCGYSLPCSPYANMKLVTCAVCSK